MPTQTTPEQTPPTPTPTTSAAPPAPVSVTDPPPTAAAPQGDPAALGDAGKRALDAERTARAAAEKTAGEYKKRLDDIEAANLSELEKAQRAAADAQGRAAEYERTVLRQRVALTKGLPADIADTLSGATEDELTAHADRLIAWRGAASPTTPQPDPAQGPRTTTADAAGDAEYARYFPTT